MTSTLVLLWLLNIFFDTLGQIAFKAGAIADNQATGWRHWFNILTNRWILLGISCYLAEFLLWLAFLSLVPLSEGVLLGSINIVVVMIAGRILFKEHLTHLRILGISLVAIGVAIVGVYA
jgi:drug/metabolite transporter (DMT)-like permease